MEQLTPISLEKTLSLLSASRLDDRPADEYQRVFSRAKRLPWNAEWMVQSMSEHILLQNTVCRLLILHTTQTHIYLPLDFSVQLDALTRFFSVSRTAENGRLQKLLLYDLQLSGLYTFLDMAHQGLLHPLFSESCKTYAALGKAGVDHRRYRLLETDEAAAPDLSDPLIRFIHSLPAGTPVDVSVYLPLAKAVDHPVLRQIAALCQPVVLAGGICGGIECVTGLMSERR